MQFLFGNPLLYLGEGHLYRMQGSARRRRMRRKPTVATGKNRKPDPRDPRGP